MIQISSDLAAGLGSRSRQPGFSILELSVVLLIAALIAAGGSSLMSAITQYNTHKDDIISAELVRQSLLTYLANEKRLPCPDTSGNGWPGDAKGNCTPKMDIGYLPYRVLEATHFPHDMANEQRVIYGVYRTPGADLVEPVIQVGDGDPRHVALVHTLYHAAKKPVDKKHPYVTGPEAKPNESDPLAEDCSRVISNPAFLIIVPGTQDKEGKSTLGGINTGVLETKCAAAPERKKDSHYGDTVHAESRLELLGWYISLTQ
jgi:prepilin-type N-terminal cleavage/methylation domain-containing protein